MVFFAFRIRKGTLLTLSNITTPRLYNRRDTNRRDLNNRVVSKMRSLANKRGRALPYNFPTLAFTGKVWTLLLVGTVWFEHTTYCLTVSRSSRWAKFPNISRATHMTYCRAYIDDTGVWRIARFVLSSKAISRTLERDSFMANASPFLSQIVHSTSKG